jgi:hypothetical protein
MARALNALFNFFQLTMNPWKKGYIGAKEKTILLVFSR